MTFENAASQCMVRGCIYRASDPSVQYAKNHDVPLKDRVPLVDQVATDWRESDPEGDATSVVG